MLAITKVSATKVWFLRVSLAISAFTWSLGCSDAAKAQHMAMPGTEISGTDTGLAPSTEFGGGSFFSQDLGTVLRFRYNSQSYGQDGHGNFDIGTMQVVTFDDWIAFGDAQVTMNDVQGVGYNIGAGVRWLSFPSYALDSGRVEGVSIWSDGTSTEAGNFFPQLGLSYESLGETWDVRANGYIPLGPQDKTGSFRKTGDIGFLGNSLSELTQAVVDSSFYVAEVEVARRLGPERDAWAFAGPYVLANDIDDTVGYRVGVRGYAYPDLLLQVAVSDDEIFNTNATFSVMWFVGRTRSDYQPACGVPDRMREPVLRNDYVALAQSTARGGIALTQVDGSALRFVHVDSNAAAGGDGTYENPYSMLSSINGAGSQSSDVILAHADSVFNGDVSTLLKNNQRLLGEGDGLAHTVNTLQRGTIVIPETSPGARNADRPMIVAAIGNAITLANGNEVANFDFDGQNITTNAIFGSNMTGNANLHHLSVTDTTNFAIALNGNTSTSNITLNEFEYDGGTTTSGGIRLNNFDGTFVATNSTLTNGTGAGLSVLGDSDGTITFQSSVTFDSIDGTAVNINGDSVANNEINGTITINSAITNDTGRAVSVQGLGAGGTARFTGAITDTNNGTGILVNSNATNSNTTFTGPIEISRGAGNNAAGFVATEAGTLEVSNTGNSIETQGGQIVRIQNTTIATNGVSFAEVSRQNAAATHAIELRDNTGGPITLGVPGDTAGEAGTIAGGAAHAIVIDNSANVTISGVIVNNTSAVAGVDITKTTTGTQTVNLNDVRVNNGLFGIDVHGGGAGAGNLVLNINDTELLRSTEAGMRFDNVDNGTIAVINATIDGDNVGANASGVRILDSNATFTFDDDTVIREFNGTDFEVAGGSGSITYSGQINNTDAAGRTVEIRTRSGGNVTFAASSNIESTNDGIYVQNNTGGTVSFLGTNELNTGGLNALTVSGNTAGTYNFNNFDITTSSGTGVLIDGNTGGTYNFNGLDIEATTTGNGLVASGGGALNVSGLTNTIRTNNGVGLDIDGMTIGNSGVQFQSVNVTNGSSNAIVLENLTGGPVLIGSPTGAANSGGTLTTAQSAIVVRNVQNADFNNVRIASAGNNAVLIEHTAAATTAMDITFDGLNLDSTTGTGMSVSGQNTNAFNLRLLDSDLDNNVDISITGSGAFGLLVDDTTINETGADRAFSLVFSGGATRGDVTIRNGSSFMAENQEALFIDSFGGTFKDIKLLVANSSFMTDAVAPATLIQSRGNTLMQTTVQGNTFASTGAALYDLEIRSDGTATARMRLNLGGDDISEFNTASGGGRMLVEELNTSDFRIFERDATIVTDMRNNDPVDSSPNDAAFDNLAAPPALPTVP